MRFQIDGGVRATVHETVAFRLGILGPTARADSLRDALRFLLVDAEADRVICLADPHFLRRELQNWARQFARVGKGTDVLDENAHAAEVSEEELGQCAIETLAGEALPETERAKDLLYSIKALRRLRAVDVLPDARSKAIEFVSGRCIMMVLDKSALTEDDVANASLVLYGRSPQFEFRRFGKRCFFSPGPLDAEHVGLLELHESDATITLFNLDGMPVWKEPVLSGGSRLSVRGEVSTEMSQKESTSSPQTPSSLSNRER